MAKVLDKLSPLWVARVAEPGMYNDGGGLYLQVTSATSKSWIFRYKMAGRPRQMGLGPLHTVSLADARRIAGENRKLVFDGTDPIEKRNADKIAAQEDAAKAVLFPAAAKEYIEANAPAWKSKKHQKQWLSTLKTYTYPVIGNVAVCDVDTPLVLKILEPIWIVKNETASRVRGRIEAILDWAKVKALRTGENPARWKGHLDQVLPKRSRSRKVRHHPALPYQQVPEFICTLRDRPSNSALALEFLILTMTRTNETICGRWTEIDFVDKSWTIPPERMKGSLEHRIPLTDRAIEILLSLRPEEPGDGFIFPGEKPHSGLSNSAMLMLVRGMNEGSDPPRWRDKKGNSIVPHGFRSSFRDWAGEMTSFPRDVVERALAHKVEDETEAAYYRSDLFEKRRKLANAWEKYCCTSRRRQVSKLDDLRAAA